MGLLKQETDGPDPSRGINAKEFNIIEKVSEEDPQMSARAWSRVISEQVATDDHLIGYATFMGPSSAKSFPTEFGWTLTLCKYQSVPIYVQEDWEKLRNRADVKLTTEPVNHIEEMRREDLAELELAELKVMAQELNLVDPEKKLSRQTLIDMIVTHELESE